MDEATGVLLTAYLVFFMQCGFCMLCAGSVRGKNAKNIILKNLLDACFGAVGWYIMGYGLAFGSKSNFFLGESNFALSRVSMGDYLDWFFHFAFAATSTTIVSGAVAERTKFEAYLSYSFFLSGWVYPIVAHWVWSSDGWLSVFRSHDALFNNSGMVDYAGGGVVHMTGGIAGLCGAWIVGPRLGRFDSDKKTREIPGHSASLALLGIFILWFAWYGFNSGSAMAIGAPGASAALCAVNTTLAAAMGCISSLLVSLVMSYRMTGQFVWDLIGAGNGVLAGLVSITASCGVVYPWAAAFIGSFGGLVYVSASNVVLHGMKIDDPLSVVSIHGVCGFWGLIAAAAFANKDLVTLSYPPLFDANGEESGAQRAFGFVVGGDGRLLVAALVGSLAITVWVVIHMAPFFMILKMLNLLRVAPQSEQEGLDVMHHGGTAYPRDARNESMSSSRPPLAGGRSSPTTTPPAHSELMTELASLRTEHSTMKTQLNILMANHRDSAGLGGFRHRQ